MSKIRSSYARDAAHNHNQRQPVLTYLVRHWRGELSLTFAFWINFVALRFLLLALDQILDEALDQRVEGLLPWAIVYSIVSIMVILPWQIIGVLRTTEQMLGDFGSPPNVLFPQSGIVVGLLMTAVSTFGMYQTYLIEKQPEPAWLALEKARESQYTIAVDSTNNRLMIKGSFDLGLTRRLRSHLVENPELEEILLSSDGGLVNQGRAVANLIRESKVSTLVTETCESACTIAFMAGDQRRLAETAKLGFHSYSYKAWNAHPNIDPEAEYRRDLAVFAERGVSREFIGQLERLPATTMWYPGIKELLASGVVHEIMPSNGG